MQLGIPDVTAPGTTLTVAGNYVGNGGILGLNTFLGTDGSPSDKLVVNGGTATGSTGIFVTNVGGPGALTEANGILVVQAENGATTTSGAFTLANPELRAGAFDYHLFRGNAFNVNDPAAANDWFLRTDFTVAGGQGGNENGGGVVEEPGGEVEFPSDPPPSVLP
ncbi:MAG TPA: autotransporter outer membrane beta-barrel domain-containing protein, partial [Candidatus Saccharimonadales bacterium]|nr:autotransporter outer membrane beta-barrel domain-containing protein [Candidatus Saccharimonadales bacterium]